MNNLSNERLQKIASWREQYGNGHNVVIPAEEAEALARELLTLREAGKEPVAWDYEWASCITCDGPQDFKRVIEREAPPEWAIEEGQARRVIQLYAAPQLPAVPDDYQHLSELYHAQEKRLFKLAQRIKGQSFDKYAHSPSQAIDVLEMTIFGGDDTSKDSAIAAAPKPGSDNG